MKKDNLKQVNIIIVIVMVLLVIGGIFLFAYQKDRYSDVFFKYNGFEVHKVTAGEIPVYKISLVSTVDNNVYSIESRYNPKDLEDIPINIDFEDIYDKKALFITMDSNATGVSVLAATEISKVTGNSKIFRYPKETFGALKEPIEDKNITVVTCGNVNSDIGVISFEISDKSSIFPDRGCVIVAGKDEYDLIRVADRLMLTLLGIMKP